MFTIRFENHSAGYTVYSCESYNVGRINGQDQGDGKSIALFDHEKDEPPFFYGEVGDNYPYREAYVTNEHGNTIDRIRCFRNTMKGDPAVAA